MMRKCLIALFTFGAIVSQADNAADLILATREAGQVRIQFSMVGFRKKEQFREERLSISSVSPRLVLNAAASNEIQVSTSSGS